MGSISETLAGLGGIGRTCELVEAGFARGALASALAAGDLQHVRKGWYALPGLPQDVIRAARIGGTACCITAARLHGLWIPPDLLDLHVAVPPTSARLRRPDDSRARLGVAELAGVEIHWTAISSRRVQSLPDAIAMAVTCCGPEVGFVLLESALHFKLLTRGDLARLNAVVPRRFRSTMRLASKDSESGTESLMKFLLVSLGVKFRQQVSLAGIGRVDFVVGENLVVEVDSKEHHSEPYADRRRDALLSAIGKRSLRFMYSQLVYERQSVEAAILGAMIRGDLA